MSNRLDDIKARAEGAVTTRDGVAHLNGTFLVHSAEDVSSLIAAVEAVSLHVPEADTAGNVYCVVRGADYYTDCPTFKSGDTWPDHIANVVARALGDGKQ